MVIRHERYTWVVSERKQAGRKPIKFLLQKQPTERYISSLFPESRGWYRFDYKGIKYRVNLSDTVDSIGKNLFNLLQYNNKQVVALYGYTPPETGSATDTISNQNPTP
jgi:hypothetical protein